MQYRVESVIDCPLISLTTHITGSLATNIQADIQGALLSSNIRLFMVAGNQT